MAVVSLGQTLTEGILSFLHVSGGWLMDGPEIPLYVHAAALISRVKPRRPTLTESKPATMDIFHPPHQSIQST
jgi:hypothetical protein